MAYTPTTPILGTQPIAVASTVQNHPLGTRMRATDPTFGEGEFLYLKGVVSTVTGSLVQYDQVNGTTVLAPITTKGLNLPLGVAMAANVASNYGWYQVGGAAVIKKTAVKVSPGVALYLSGTAGRVQSAVATGRQLVNAVSINAATVASATSTITAELQYPFAQGQII